MMMHGEKKISRFATERSQNPPIIGGMEGEMTQHNFGQIRVLR